MRILILICLVLLISCEERKSGFIEIKSSHHHHLALEAIKSAVPGAEYFEVHQWTGPDTLYNWKDTSVQIPIRYGLEFDYKEKRGEILKKYGIIVLDGKTDSVVIAEIMDRPAP